MLITENIAVERILKEGGYEYAGEVNPVASDHFVAEIYENNESTLYYWQTQENEPVCLIITNYSDGFTPSEFVAFNHEELESLLLILTMKGIK